MYLNNLIRFDSDWQISGIFCEQNSNENFGDQFDWLLGWTSFVHVSKNMVECDHFTHVFQFNLWWIVQQIHISLVSIEKLTLCEFQSTIMKNKSGIQWLGPALWSSALTLYPRIKILICFWQYERFVSIKCIDPPHPIRVFEKVNRPSIKCL